MILISISLATLLAFLFLIKHLLKPTTTSTKLNPPPSPWKLPVIGNLHQMSLHPHRSLRSLSDRYGPLMLLHFGRTPILVVSSVEFAQEVLKTHDVKFASRPITKAIHTIFNGGRDVGFAPYGEYWRQMKSICMLKLLSNKMVRSFANIRQEEIELMMEKLEKACNASSSANLSELLLTLTSDIMCRVVLGGKYNSDEDSSTNVKNTVRTFSNFMGEFPIGEYIPSLAWIDRVRGLDSKIEKVNKTFDDFLEKIVQGHVDADEKRLDFVDVLLSIQQDETLKVKFDRSDLKLILLDMFLAGTATTASLMEWTMTELITHPECMKKLQDEIRSNSPHNLYVTNEETENMKYLQAVIKEGLRLHPSVPLLVPRELSEDVKVKGYDIVAGTQVLVNAWAIQRDTTTWGTDAEEFKPERHFDSDLGFQGQDFKYIPFGSGRRLCPGIGFGLAKTHVTLANLVKRFNWRVETRPPGDQYHTAEASGMDVCRKFPLIAFPTSP